MLTFNTLIFPVWKLGDFEWLSDTWQKLARLQTLDLGESSGLKAFVPHLGNLISLETLGLSSTDLDSESIKVLASELPKLEKLESLDLRYNDLSSEDEQILREAVKGLSHFEKLEL